MRPFLFFCGTIQINIPSSSISRLFAQWSTGMSASWDKAVCIWNMRDAPHKFSDNAYVFWSVRFSPNGQHIVAGNSGDVHTGDGRDGSPLGSFHSVGSWLQNDMFSSHATMHSIWRMQFREMPCVVKTTCHPPKSFDGRVSSGYG